MNTFFTVFKILTIVVLLVATSINVFFQRDYVTGMLFLILAKLNMSDLEKNNE